VFTNGGEYQFQLTANDGQAATFSLITVTSIPPTTVSISADVSDAYELGPVPGDFTLTRQGGETNLPLTVYLLITGQATNGIDYVTLTNLVTFDADSNSIAIPVLPILDNVIKSDESVIVSIVSNVSYTIQNDEATVTIHPSPYSEWSIANFTLEQLTQPQLTGPAAQFVPDGIANFAAYAFNLNPKIVNTNPPYLWGLETNPADNLLHLTITYTRRLPPRDVEYGAFVSTDLLSWSTGTNVVEEFSSTPDANGITETVKTRALMPVPGSTNLYMGIGVWLQQVATDP
jgi:hypothetical protein